MVLVCALCWVSSAQGASYRWYMDTDTGKSVAMDEVEYLLRSDNSTDFSVVVKNGDYYRGQSQHVQGEFQRDDKTGFHREQGDRFYGL